MKDTGSSTPAERALERIDDRAAREAAEDAFAVHGFEVLGYGSTATWSRRS